MSLPDSVIKPELDATNAASTVKAGLSGGAVVLAGQAFRLVIEFVGLTVLSRLLPPEDFGIIAMVMIFIMLGETLRDFGMGTVGLQRANLSQQQASNLFWVNTVFGMVAGVLLAAATPLIVGLYGEPRLYRVIPALALALPLNGMSAQYTINLSRRMMFKQSVVADVLSRLIAVGLAIGGAIIGLGVWALVIQTIAAAALGLLLRMMAARWVPVRPRRDPTLHSDVKDGAGFGLAGIFQYIASNADTALIGINWDATSVGLYDRAFRLLRVPAGSILGPLMQVVIPTLNRAKAEGRSVDEVLLRLQRLLGFVIVWVFAVTAAIAAWLIPTVLGNEWNDAIPLFQILAIGGAVQVFSNISYWQFVISNLGKQLFYYNIITKLLAAALIVIGSFISLRMVALMASIGLAVAWPINLIWLAKTARQDSWQYFRNGIHILAAGVLAYLAGSALMRLPLGLPAIAQAVTAALAATVIYVLIVVVRKTARHDLKGFIGQAKLMFQR